MHNSVVDVALEDLESNSVSADYSPVERRRIDDLVQRTESIRITVFLRRV